MTSKFETIVNKSVEIGQTLIINYYEYTVTNIVLFDENQYPNLHKNNIGGHVYLRKGQKGKNIYCLALNNNGNIKNGLVCDTGVKF